MTITRQPTHPRRRSPMPLGSRLKQADGCDGCLVAADVCSFLCLEQLGQLVFSLAALL